MNRRIEKAYKAWRATVPLTPIAVPAGMVRSRRRLMTMLQLYREWLNMVYGSWRVRVRAPVL